MGPIGCSETSVRNYHYLLCNSPEECSSDLLSSCSDWGPWKKPGYITMTRRQSNNQWSNGIAAHSAPQNSECKNLLENFSPRFLGSRRHPPQWLSSKGPNYQSGVLLISAGTIEGQFEEKTPREDNQGGLVLARQCPGYRALATQKKLAYLGFQCLDHPPYSPDLAPSDYHLFSRMIKQLKGRHFSSDVSFLSGRAKDLRAAPRIITIHQNISPFPSYSNSLRAL